MVTKMNPQISMDEKVINDEELEKLCEEREELKPSVSNYRKADKKTKEKIKSIETPKPYRVGRFIISESKIEPHEVSFETNGNMRINIKVIE